MQRSRLPDEKWGLVSSPRLGTPPFVRSVPKLFFLETQKDQCVRSCHKNTDHVRTLPEGVMLDNHDFNTSVHSKWHTCPPEQDFGDRQSFFVIYGFKWGFPGLIVCAETRKRCSVAQNLRRLLRHIFWCVFAGGFWSHTFLKSTCTDFGGGLVKRERVYAYMCTDNPGISA
jgi:hypothetical protein